MPRGDAPQSPHDGALKTIWNALFEGSKPVLQEYALSRSNKRWLARDAMPSRNYETLRQLRTTRTPDFEKRSADSFGITKSSTENNEEPRWTRAPGICSY